MSRIDFPPLDFIVTGWRRSGTTMFASLLNDHPDLDCDNESFNYFFAGADHFAFLRECIPARPAKVGAKLYGLKTLDPFLVPSRNYPAIIKRARREGLEESVPSQNEYEDLVAAFTDRLLAADPLIINVVRPTLEIYVSEQIALQRREFRYRTEFEQKFALVFDIDHFRRWFAVKQEIDARVAFLKRPERTLHVYYQDFRNSEKRQPVMDCAFAHLGIEPRKVEPATRKQLPESLRDSVINHDEMIAMVKAEGWDTLVDALD